MHEALARGRPPLHARRVSPRRAVGYLWIASAVACGGGGARTSALPPAGATGEHGAPDDGVGLLARASVKFTTGPADDRLNTFTDEAVPTGYIGYDDYGGFQYGGGLYGGGLYGGTSYASYNPQISWTSVTRGPTYEIKSLGDAGAITGTVTWSKAPGARLVSSPCGEIDNPTLRLGAKNEAGGAIVYLAEPKAGRPLSTALHALAVGGTVEVQACAMRPTAQVMSPTPAPVTVYGGDKRMTATARRTSIEEAARRTTTEAVALELAAGGYDQVGVDVGITTIADKAGALVPAWIIAPGHPYFAITDDAGRFQIGDVVPGTYKLVVWHPPVVTGWRDGKPQFGEPVVVSRTVRVGAYATARADVALP